MKVKDLILRLQECDPEDMVVVDGYEGGVSELKNIKDRVGIVLNVNDESWYGAHEIAYAEDNPHINAVYLMRS